MSDDRGNRDAPKLEWEDTQFAVTKTRLVRPKTVALCGFAPNSRHLAPYDKRTLEVWGCNEAYVADFMKNSKGEFRADRWFQMHLHEDWTRKNNPNDPRHLEWLGQEHNFPIYMQQKFDEVPNSVEFPIDDITKEHFGNLYAIHPEKSIPWLEAYGLRGYYTSTFAYMVAMALHLKFERIEVWGFNMGSQSEYLYQKAGAEFWIALAMKSGVEFAVAGNSPILKGELYGYEFSQIIQEPAIHERELELQQLSAGMREQAVGVHGARYDVAQMQKKFATEKNDEVADFMKEHGEELLQEELSLTSQTNFLLGALNECDGMIKHLTCRHEGESEYGSEEGWIGRLSLEVRLVKIRNKLRAAQQRADTISGARSELRKVTHEMPASPNALATFELREADLLQGEIVALNEVNFWLGALNQIKLFMLRIDARIANQVDDYDIGHRVEIDMSDEIVDVLEEYTRDGEKEETTTEAPTENAGGTGRDPEPAPEDPERPSTQAAI